MKMDFTQIASRMFNTPLLIMPSKAEIILGAVGDRLKVGNLITDCGDRIPLADLQAQAAEANIMALGGPRRQRQASKVYRVEDGVAIIPVRGTTVQRNGIDPSSGMTGYDGLKVKLVEAVNDPDVTGIVFDIDSPGGEVSGLFDFVDQIHLAGQHKPTRAILDEMGASAAYAIASACHEITAPRTGCAGSIGVVCMHADNSQYFKNVGVDVTFIYAGKHKVDGNSFEPLPPEVLAEIQGEINAIYDIFVTSVANGRVNLSETQIRATEARCPQAPEALKMGLIDKVMPADASLIDFIETHQNKSLSGGQVQVGGVSAQTITVPKAGTQDQVENPSASVEDKPRDGSAATDKPTIDEKENETMANNKVMILSVQGALMALGAALAADPKETINLDDLGDDGQAALATLSAPAVAVALAEVKTTEVDAEAEPTNNDKDVTSAVKAENERVLGIAAALKGKADDALIKECQEDPNCSIEAAALRALASGSADAKAYMNAREVANTEGDDIDASGGKDNAAEGGSAKEHATAITDHIAAEKVKGRILSPSMAANELHKQRTAE